MKKLNTITSEDIKTIFNASYRKREKVNQFGQQISNPNLQTMESVDLIDTLDILTDLYDECIEAYDLTAYNMHNLEGTNFEWLEDFEVNAINTYNWSAPLTNHLDIRVYKVEGFLFMSVAVHNGWSDVRVGYMTEFLFKFDTSYSSEDWAVIFSDLPSTFKSFSINDLYFRFSFFNEFGVYDIYDFKGTYEEYDVYVGEYDDCTKWIEENKEELI